MRSRACREAVAVVVKPSVEEESRVNRPALEFSAKTVSYS